MLWEYNEEDSRLISKSKSNFNNINNTVRAHNLTCQLSDALVIPFGSQNILVREMILYPLDI